MFRVMTISWSFGSALAVSIVLLPTQVSACNFQSLPGGVFPLDLAACASPGVAPAIAGLASEFHGGQVDDLAYGPKTPKGGSGNAISFGVWPTARLARSWDRGYSTKFDGVARGSAPGFRSDESSFFGSVDVDAGRLGNVTAVDTLKIGLFGGIGRVSTAVDAVGGSPYANASSNTSAIFGASYKFSVARFYAVGTVTGFAGETDYSYNLPQLLDASGTPTFPARNDSGSYRTSGFALSQTVGYSHDLGGGIFVDPRVGLSYVDMSGTDHTVVSPFPYDITGISYRALTGQASIGLFTSTPLAGGVVGWYGRLGLDQRLFSDNHAYYGGSKIEFDTARTTLLGSVGANYKVGALTWSIESSLRGSADNKAFAGKAGVKFEF